MLSVDHKVLTYVEYRAVSGVFQNIDPPLRSASVSSPRANILEDARHWIGLLQYNLSTVLTHRPPQYMVPCSPYEVEHKKCSMKKCF
jgi:hypothetical protein